MTDTRKALETAVQHIEHMSAWIAKQGAGYSFESLGEDMPGIREAALRAPSSGTVTREEVAREIKSVLDGWERTGLNLKNETIANRLASHLYAILSLPSPAVELRDDIWPLTDHQLWEMSCLTRWQIAHWTDADLAKHAAGVRHTIQYLMMLLDALAALPAKSVGTRTSNVEPEELEALIGDRSAARAANAILKEFIVTRRPAPPQTPPQDAREK